MMTAQCGTAGYAIKCRFSFRLSVFLSICLFACPSGATLRYLESYYMNN